MTLSSPLAPLRRAFAALALLAALSGPAFLAAPGASAAAPAIPDRPEKLTFPPLQYEPPKPAEHRVALASGPVAYVVEDHELPLVTVTILIRTGRYVEPADKTGLAALTGQLLARGGAGAKSAEELEERLDFLAAQLSSSIGATEGTVRLNLLSKDLDEGLALLRDVLATPRFQEDKLRLLREQTLQELKQRNDDAADIEAREANALAVGPGFWSARLPTAASLGAISREDLVAFHRRWIHPRNFVVAASGDLRRQDLVARLEKLFADWPFPGETPPPIPSNPSLATPGAYLVDKDVNQGRVTLLLPGMKRDDPDFFAATVMNDILGGGGFTSRIMNRVRSDEGLAYSASSAVPEGVYYPEPIQAEFQSKSRTVAYAASIVLEELRRIATQPVSEEELNTAKRSFIDTFPRMFSTKAAVAGRFALDEFTGRYARDPGYWKEYRSRIDAVTRDDVQRVAARWLKPEDLVILVVGQRAEVLKGHPDHAVRLPDLVGGRLVDLPLRDPLTLEPMPSAAPAVQP